MRIDAYNAVSQVYQTNTKMASKTKSISDVKDNFEISDVAKVFQVAKQAVSATPDVREDKVAEIKAKMASGNYTVTPEDFAEKVMNDASTITF